MNIVKKLFYNYLINRKIGDNDNTLSTNKHKKLDIVISINFTGDINQLELLNHLVQVFSPMEKAKMELTYVIEEPSEKSLKIKSRGGVMNSKTLANFENNIKLHEKKEIIIDGFSLHSNLFGWVYRAIDTSFAANYYIYD